jgi:hypothetical protein
VNGGQPGRSQVDLPSSEQLPPLNLQRELGSAFAKELAKQLSSRKGEILDTDEKLAQFLIENLGQATKAGVLGKTELGGSKGGLGKAGEADKKKTELGSVEALDKRFADVMTRRRLLGPPEALKGEERERLERSENLDRLEKETDLAERQKQAMERLTPKKLSPRDVAIEKREREVALLEGRAKLAEREKALRELQQQSPEERALSDRDEELKDLEKEAEKKEELRQEKLRAERAAKKLKPQVNKVGQVLGGRKL